MKKSPQLTPKEMKEQELARSLQDTLSHDARTSGLKLSVSVRGCVAHVRGEVPSAEQRQVVRKLLRRLHGLHAVWDLLHLPKEKLTVIDIGCGGVKQVPEAVGVDQYAGPDVEIVTNLEESLPFEENSLDHVFAVNVLEHIRNLQGLMNDLHRTLRPTGILHVIVPNWQDVIAVEDPTHVRFFDRQTFKYFCEIKPGFNLWKPLIVSSSKDTVFADLTPVKGKEDFDPSQLALWFD